MSSVSILVPTYNRRDYLKQCVDSLLATTVPCEIIVSDNASTDGTAELMAGYDDPRLRYIRQPENTGGLNNYNFLLRAATKEYVCLFGDDDIALPGCFEAKVAVLDNAPEVGGIFSNLMALDEHGTLFRGPQMLGRPDSSHITGWDAHVHLLINCCVYWQSLVFRRELYLENGELPPNSGLVDWDYLIGFAQKHQFAFINQPTVAVRFHPVSALARARRNEDQIVRDALFVWRKWLLETDDVPVLTSTSWSVMTEILKDFVRVCWGPDEVRTREALAEFEALQQEYHARMERRFYHQLSQWHPNQSDVDAEGLPIFRPGLAPLPVDSTKAVLYFHHPRWADGHWKQVVADYVQAFKPTDNVELILWLDPDQGVTVEAASELITGHIAGLGLDPQNVADMQLLTESLSLEEQARLYTAMHVLVPAGDARLLDRGAKLAKVMMTQGGPEAWRRLAESLLGPGALSPR